MNFEGELATLNRLMSESAAWRLLRADNAPLILAFVSELFSKEKQVSFSQARLALEGALDRLRALGNWEGQTSAGCYLHQWIQSGWLREMDDTLSQTDACEVAKQFYQGLAERSAHTTASHLKIVQEAVREFTIAVSPDVDKRLALLNKRKKAIEREIVALKAGEITQLSELEQREQLREIYQLASVLTGDFRRLEDEVRQLDQQLRVQMIESEQSRGEVLLAMMEKEILLEKTDAGSAFESFFQLLCDQNRTIEFSDQIRSLLNLPVAKQLTSRQRHFLSQLIRELTRESERVLVIRRRSEEGLRAYIESGAVMEQRAVEQLMCQLERKALVLKEKALSMNQLTQIRLPVGLIKLFTPLCLVLADPEQALNIGEVQEHANEMKASDTVLESLSTLSLENIYEDIKQAVQREGPMTLGAIIKQQPITQGLQELIAFVRVAITLGASSWSEKEKVLFRDKQGCYLEATLKTYLFGPELFEQSSLELLL